MSLPAQATPPRKRIDLGFLRRWQKTYVWLLLAMMSLALASAINGWRSFVPAQVVLNRQDQLGQELPVQSPLPGPILVLSAHPDDETLGAAGIIQDALSRGQQVWVVFMTSGDAFPWTPAYVQRFWDGGVAIRAYGARRMDEARAAAGVLGVPASHVLFLGFPDRGLTRMENQYLTTPFFSPSTRVSRVPYQDALRPDAPYTGQQVERELQLIARMVRPKIILTTSVLDHHPDHRATAHAAVRLADEIGARVFFFPVHDGLEWPIPKGNHPDLGLYPPRAQEQGGVWRRFPLTGEQEETKGDAVSVYRSQTLVLGRFMWAFVRRNELLRPAEAGAGAGQTSSGQTGEDRP
ncbi:PIG-L deacetylase family protein [Deinococcus sp.]|uniref:PIG-L deacetylase family protein n=1 Tax=Deinococcus sp. TaxID=47478 RepID=UPI0025BA8CAE|nr:PIG-L family deacetylase [Deinococcus sp.]